MHALRSLCAWKGEIAIVGTTTISGGKGLFMDLSLSPFRSRRLADVCVCVCARVYVRLYECASAYGSHASAQARSTIVIKRDANWWQSEVRPKAHARRPGTSRVFVPLSASRCVCPTVFGESPGNSRSRRRLILRVHY